MYLVGVFSVKITINECYLSLIHMLIVKYKYKLFDNNYI